MNQSQSAEEQMTQLAKQFVNQYYSTLMQNKMNLVSFYTNASHMTYGTRHPPS